MKARLEQLSLKRSNYSFLCYEVRVPAFDFVWHYHPEYELTYIIKGRGKRLVGDSYESFKEGDLVLLGPSLPHTWVTEKVRRQSCAAIVIQFTQEFIQPLLAYKEMSGVNRLITRASGGLRFDLTKSSRVEEMIQNMIGRKEFEVWVTLIQVLQELSLQKATALSSSQFKPLRGDKNQQRINKVLQYVQRDFRDKISLQKAASLIHLSESAFCKFFKRVSGKTFSDYVNEIRIANACQLLIETDNPIGQISVESGFESLTYFNRVFLKKKGMRPGEIRKLPL